MCCCNNKQEVSQGNITIVGLGPGDFKLLTMETWELLNSGSTQALPTLEAAAAAARSSFAICPIWRRYPVSVPALPSTPMRTCSSAAVSAACAICAMVCSRSASSSSTIAILPSLSVSRPAPPARRRI